MYSGGYSRTTSMPKTAPKRKTIKPYEKAVRALFHLSHTQAGTVDEVLSLIIDAPDPESAHQAVASRVHVESDVLAQKWHDTIVSAWSHCHPRVPLLPDILLTEYDVKDIPFLRDVREFLKEIEREPASMIKDGEEVALDPQEAIRLALVMPSWQGMPEMAVEHEWAIVPVRRLRELLQTLGLARVWQGKLMPVRSRVNLFLKFPLAQQFYALWHADVYHVNWGSFAPAWQSYIDLIQGYLPLLWDIHADVETDLLEEPTDWAVSMLEAFTPLWEQEGLMRSRPSGNVLHMYRELALPTIIKKLVFDDIFLRYGLLTPQYDPLTALIKQGDDTTASYYTWTSVGEKILQAERDSDLPCGIELLRS